MLYLRAGRVHMSFATAIATREHIQSGSLKALAVTTSERVDSLPDVPTMAEAGFPNVQITACNGLLVTAGPPTGIVEQVNSVVQAVLHHPDASERLQTTEGQRVGKEGV